MLTVFFFIASALALQQLPVLQQQQYEFASLVRKHGRNYVQGDAEYQKRFLVYQSNLKRIELARKNDPGAKYGMNLFFDLSQEEFQSKYKMPKQTIPASQSAAAAQAGIAKSCLGGGAMVSKLSKREVAALPAKFDWRTHQPPILTPIKNQAACGSCWAFSTMETLESSWALSGHNLTELAPQQLVDCSHACSMENGEKVCNQGCGGGWPWAAVTTLIQEGGAEASSSYPYTGQDGTCQFDKSKVVAVPTNYTCVSGPHTASADDMAHALLKQPLSIALDAEWFQFYLGGVSDPYLCGAKSLDHAVQIVGYDHEVDWFGSRVEYWIIRNSWSASWGENGYMKLIKNKDKCGVGNAVMMIETA